MTDYTDKAPARIIVTAGAYPLQLPDDMKPQWEGRKITGQHEYVRRDLYDALEAERDELLDDVKAFLPMWAIEYARRAELPEGHLLPQHYDRMEQIGCRMVAFTRAALTAPTPQAPDAPAPPQ